MHGFHQRNRMQFQPWSVTRESRVSDCVTMI